MRISDWSSDVCSSDLAEPPEEVLLHGGARIHHHVHGADVAGVHEDLRHRQPPLLGMEVADGEARHADRLAHVIAIAEAYHAAVEGHGGGKELEHRAHLVDAEGSEEQPTELKSTIHI